MNYKDAISLFNSCFEEYNNQWRANDWKATPELEKMREEAIKKFFKESGLTSHEWTELVRVNYITKLNSNPYKLIEEEGI